MKNRRIILISFLLVTTLCVGIGYAAVNDTLTISGSAEFNAEDITAALDGDIYFSAALPESGGAEESNNASVGSDPDTATFTVKNLKDAGETAVFVFTVKNEGDLDFNVEIAAPTIKGDGTITTDASVAQKYYSVDTQWVQRADLDAEADASATGDSITIPANGEKFIKVTVTLNSTPLEAVSMKATITVNATAVDPNI